MAFVTIPSITWFPYQGGGAGSLIATVNLDSVTGTDFLVATDGQYSNQTVYADGVIIDNTSNNAFVSVKNGPLQTSIVPFGRDVVLLDKNLSQKIEIIFTQGTIQLIFFRGRPPISGQVLNQAGGINVSSQSGTTYLQADVPILGGATFIGPSTPAIGAAGQLFMLSADVSWGELLTGATPGFFAQIVDDSGNIYADIRGEGYPAGITLVRHETLGPVIVQGNVSRVYSIQFISAAEDITIFATTSGLTARRSTWISYIRLA